MWGNILTEVSYQTNFNVTFPNNRTDILIHLTQWQYWWWFWFSFVWVLYYLLLARLVRFRTLKFRPKIASTFRPHGKWGDLIVCFMPVSWCINILINSNFLLKLIEWQCESSLFTIRIRARQWYWVYKFDLKNFTDILSAPKNIGHNKWQVLVFGELQTADDYLHILQLRSQNKWVKKYWSDLLNKFNKQKKAHIISNQEKFKLDFNGNNTSNGISSLSNNYFSSNFNEFNLNEFAKNYNKNCFSNNSSSVYYSSFINSNKNFYENKELINSNEFLLSGLDNSKFYSNNLFDVNFKKIKNRTNGFFNFLRKDSKINSTGVSFITHNDFLENSRWVKRSSGKNLPLRFIKYPLIDDNDNNGDLLRLRFNTEESKIHHKVLPHTTYLTLKQKRYKRRKIIAPYVNYYKTEEGIKTKKIKFSGNLFLKDNSILVKNLDDSTMQYRMIKKNKKRNEEISVVHSKRLLRVKKTLVIPTHVNITAITNSFDIVHSWFVPGLGLKMDCVPGRATHHTFYVDHVGFYYGQCAEVCGRYHHHMPIRVCALPFEHFLVWWHSFGLPKLIFTNNQKKYETYYAFRKFVW